MFALINKQLPIAVMSMCNGSINDLTTKIGEKYKSKANGHQRQDTFPAMFQKSSRQGGSANSKHYKEENLVRDTMVNLAYPNKWKDHERKRNYYAVHQAKNWPHYSKDFKGGIESGWALRMRLQNLLQLGKLVKEIP